MKAETVLESVQRIASTALLGSLLMVRLSLKKFLEDWGKCGTWANEETAEADSSSRTSGAVCSNYSGRGVRLDCGEEPVSMVQDRAARFPVEDQPLKILEE